MLFRSLMGVDPPAIKLKFHVLVAVNQFSRLRRQALAMDGSSHSLSNPPLINGGWGDFHRSPPLSLAPSRPERFLDLVAHRVAQGEELLTATIAVVPPFSLHAGHVASVVEIPDPIVRRAVGRRPGRCFAAEAEFMDVSFPTVGAVKKKSHISGDR